MGLIASQLCRFRARSILEGFVVPKLMLLFTKAGWSAQPYSTNFDYISVPEYLYPLAIEAVHGEGERCNIH